MKYLFLIVILLLIVLTQVSVLPLFITKGTPHLLLIYILTMRFIKESRSVVFAAVVGGALLDLTHPSILGSTSLILVLILGVLSLLRQRIRLNYVQMGLFTLISSAFLRFIVSFPNFTWRLLLIGAIADTILLLMLYPLMRRFYTILVGKGAIELRY